MIFDKACGIVERHFPELRKHMENAKLFYFPGRAHELLPKRMENAEFVAENFFLPFRTVAVEDTASLVILHDLDPNAKGVYVEREFIELLPLDSMGWGEFREGKAPDGLIGGLWSRQDIEKRHKGEIVISKGKIRYAHFTTTEHLVEGAIEEIAIADKTSIRAHFRVPPNSMEMQSVLANISTAVEEVIYFNSPDRFIVESIPV